MKLKKIKQFCIIMTLIVMAFPSISNATYYVLPGFYDYYHDGRGDNISQDSGSNSDLYYACGTLSLLAANAYFAHSYNGDLVEYIENSQKLTEASNRLYYYLDKSPSDRTTPHDLRDIAANKWQWNYVSCIGSSSANNAVMALRSNIESEKVSLVLIDGQSSMAHTYNVSHWILVYKVTSRNISYFDSWTGTLEYASTAEFINSWGSWGGLNYVRLELKP